jgi:prepilin-type N-terminal cleavage/methylation domain-containing protein
MTNRRKNTRRSNTAGCGIAQSSFGHSNCRSTGFTLIELMISIALVLVLILGVNQVFQYTTQAVGAGEAINSAIRGSRAAEATFAGDLGNMVSPGSGPTDSASLIIASMQAYAYRNKADMAAEGDLSRAPTINSTNSAPSPPQGAPFQDFANSGYFGDPNVPGDVTYPYTYNSRNHRLDVLSFFARDLFHRQTGNPGTFVDNMAATEAWVWYGHLQLPDNGGFDINKDFPHVQGFNDTFPCAGTPATNPNNCFASQLVLGRVATLLVPATGTAIYDNANNPQWYLGNLPAAGLAPANDPFSPLAEYTKVNQTAASGAGDFGPYYLPDSRVDLAPTSIAAFKAKVALCTNPSSVSYTKGWWDLMMDGNPQFSDSQRFARFKCNPFVPKPMQSVNMAMASPYFLGGCSQFTVEYAGDYMIQDNNPGDVYTASVPNSMNYGAFKGAGQDGQIDFQLITTNGITRKQIIWYGLPRSTSGTGSITYTNSMPKLDQTTLPLKSTMPNGDVAPLAAWLGQTQSFEKVLPGPVMPGTTPVLYSLPSDIMKNGDRYTCAWAATDVKPKLIRITITLDDPTGRLPDGQTYQYVFAVP